MSGVKRYKLGGNISPVATIFLPEIVVDASDYDRDVSALTERNDALEFQAAHNYEVAQLLLAERDELRAQVEAMRALLTEARLMTFVVNSGQSGVLRGQIDAALQAKP